MTVTVNRADLESMLDWAKETESNLVAQGLLDKADQAGAGSCYARLHSALYPSGPDSIEVVGRGGVQVRRGQPGRFTVTVRSSGDNYAVAELNGAELRKLTDGLIALTMQSSGRGGSDA